MKKRLIAILLLVTMLFTQLIPSEAMAVVGNQFYTAVNKVKEKDNLDNPFMDVREDSWYYDAVQYARINNFFSGTSANKFDPDKPISRGMFVTVLGRMAGVDQAQYKGQSVFSDVKADDYYAPYIAWASKHSIAMGVGNDKFNPNDIINREQMAVLFVRYFEIFNVNYDTGANITTIPADLDAVSPWAQETVLKLWKTGLLSGDGINFNPRGNASRAQAATLCMRTDKAVETWYKEPGIPSDRVKVDPNTEENPATPGPSTGGGSNSGSGDGSNPGGGGENPGENPGGGENPGENPGGGETGTSYTVTFTVGSKTEEISYPKNTLLSTLPTPDQPAGKVFLGWYFPDSDKRVTSEDQLTSDITLEAKFAETVPLQAGGAPDFVSALNQVANFKIIVTGSEPVLGTNFTLRNITSIALGEASDSEDEVALENIKIEETSSGSGVWTISGNEGFNPGFTYVMDLTKEGLSFSGDSAGAISDFKAAYGDSMVAGVRRFTFSIQKDGTLNTKLQSDIKYIPAGILNKDDRANLMEYSGLFLASTDGEGNTTYTVSDGSGSFSYPGDDIQVGDTVSIFLGDHPEQRKPEKRANGDETEQTKNESITYVKITKIENGTYYYVAAEAEDVLFFPDMLPINVTDFTDWSESNIQITISNSDLNFTSGYREIGLGSDTTVDEGDFMLFYSGTSYTHQDAVRKNYGEITKIYDNGDGTTTIEYKVITDEKTVLAAMDLYDETEYTEAELTKIIDENKKEIQDIIEAQLMESDFFDEAGEYLAGLALQTDEVRGFLGDDLTMSNCTITCADGSPLGADDLALMGNISDMEQDGKKPGISVSISPKLSHFDGSGVRLEITVNYKFVIERPYATNKSVEVNLTALFEQEVTFGYSVNGGAVWKRAWIIPYIADFRISGNLDLGTYTGIGITATAKLSKEEEPWGLEMPESVGELLFSTKLLDLSDSIEKLMEGAEKVFPEEEGTASGDLAKKYAAFMEDANEDWVELVSVNLINLHGAVDPLHILAFGIEVDFVVSANMNVALGMTFFYENHKRHTFTLLVLSKKSDSESVDLSTNGYQFDFYVMGNLALRAGVRAKVTVGLFSTRAAGIGLQIEAGAYTRLCGYFYYHLANYKQEDGNWKKENSSSGALLVEVGAYLDLNFIAEALNGKYSYAPTIYSNEWPLFTAGERENVYDFSYKDDPSFDIYYVDTYTLPSSVFDMIWMDLTTGELKDEEGNLNTSNFDKDTVHNGDDEAYFAVELSNPNFTYNPENNQISIKRTPDSWVQNCEMTITWKGNKLSSSSEVLNRTIKLKWSDTSDYTISFVSNGGTACPMIKKGAGTELTIPSPEKQGYNFGGWYTSADLNEESRFKVTTMPTYHLKLYAKWNPADVTYTVEHNLKGLNGRYVLDKTETQNYGKTGEQTNAEPLSYTGFTAQPIEQKTIKANGSTRVTIYYDRNYYDLEFKYGNGSNDVN